MGALRRFVLRLVNAFRPSRAEPDLAREVRSHLTLLEDEFRRRGMSEEEARYAASRAFGGRLEQVRETHRDARSFRWLDEVTRDVRHALRGLRRSPAFAFVAIASLALGIGANTAIFSFVNAILIQRLPVAEPDRIVQFDQAYRGNNTVTVLSLRDIDSLATQVSALNGVFGRFATPVSLSGGDTAKWVSAVLVTGHYFDTLQLQPAAGRLFDADDVRNADAVCVLSYDTWQSEFGGDWNVVGSSVLLNGHRYRVAGVIASGFSGVDLQHHFNVAIPATRIGDFVSAFAGPSGTERLRSMSWLSPLGRLKPGAGKAQAQAQVQAILKEANYRKYASVVLEAASHGIGPERVTFGPTFVILLGVVGLVLLMACANLASVLLARAQSRGREFSLRVALGASRARLIRMLLMEAGVIAIVGGSAGIAVSFWMERTLEAFLNTGRSAATTLDVAPDVTVAVFGLVLTAATAVVFGLLPAVNATRTDLLSSLKNERAIGGPRRRAFARRTLVVGQIALSLGIVFIAGLLTWTLRTLTARDLGFQADRVLGVRIDPSANAHSPTETGAIFEEILTRARALRGVVDASLATNPPGGSDPAMSMAIDVPTASPQPDEKAQVVTFDFVSPHYFETLGQPMLRGRDFNDTDTAGSQPVAVVNQTFTRHYFQGDDPVGRSFRLGQVSVRIVAVVGDTYNRGMRNGTTDLVYMPTAQGPPASETLLLRIGDDPEQIPAAVRAIVGGIDPRIPVISIHTLDVDLAAGFSSERILSYLATLFAALATVLAGVGLYGVMAYAISSRTREIGIRFALGAQTSDVAYPFAREAASLVVLGVAIGGPLALVSGDAIRSLLFGVGAADPTTLVMSLVVLAVTALVATSFPLLRAVRVDPQIALRVE